MSIENKININNEINNENKSQNNELDPIVIQLIEFGYNKIYSTRVFHFFHPVDVEEALDYMAINNGIIQHRFVKNNRNNNNKLCYICGEDEKNHLKELNVNNSINDSNNSINNNKAINND